MASPKPRRVIAKKQRWPSAGVPRPTKASPPPIAAHNPLTKAPAPPIQQTTKQLPAVFRTPTRTKTPIKAFDIASFSSKKKKAGTPRATHRAQ